MPLSDLSIKRRLIPKNAHIVFCCDTGSRSQVAAGLYKKISDQNDEAFESNIFIKGGLKAMESQNQKRMQIHLTEKPYWLKQGQVVEGQ